MLSCFYTQIRKPRDKTETDIPPAAANKGEFIMIPHHDLHIHTKLSLCSHDDNMTLQAILDRAKRLGVTLLAITDHMWDEEALSLEDKWYSSDALGVYNFYKKQNIAHVNKVREASGVNFHGIRVLYGCEVEFANHTATLTAKNKEQFDFVLVPHSHIHMKGFVLPENVTTDEDMARFNLDSFREIAESEIATAIAHPFLLLGYDYAKKKQVFDKITDSDFEAVFLLAAKNNKYIEINTSLFTDPVYLEDETLFIRMLRIANACGCRFTAGSDAHKLDSLSNILLIDQIRNLCGIAEHRFYAE